MPKISRIGAYEVLDSRGQPTVAATVACQGGASGWAMVPSGASTGQHEAHELRDRDERRYGGLGVTRAIAHIRGVIQAALLHKDSAQQSVIDQTLLELDGTKDKSRLGANALLAVSLACARAEAAAQGLPLYGYLQKLFPQRETILPIPQLNVINGGAHASNELSIQEYDILPVGSSSFSESIRMGAEIYQALKQLLFAEGYPVEVGDEGGFAPRLKNSEVAFTFLVRAIEKAGYTPGIDAFLGIDSAASQWYEEETGEYRVDGVYVSASELAQRYSLWQQRYPLISFEDPFAEDAWKDWVSFMDSSQETAQIIGDDLYVTSSNRLREGVIRGATNAMLIKPNQVGTLTETLQAIVLAQQAGQNVIVSHRSGDTEDPFIADLAVAVGAGQIKAGAPVHGERTAKYNRLLEIEENSGGRLSRSLDAIIERYNR